MSEEQKKEQIPESEVARKSRLKEFLGKGPAKWFEGGDEAKRPEYFDARPIASILKQAGKVAYFLMDQEGKADAILSDGKSPDESLVSTESHKYFEAMEKRFNEVVPESKIIIIDPDVVRGKYAMDPSPDASLAKSIKLYLTEKVKDKAPSVLHRIDDKYAKSIENSAFKQERQHTLALRENVSLQNIGGSGYLDIVVGSNPDMPGLWSAFNSIPGLKKELEAKSVTPEAVRDFILYHELGHATDMHRKQEEKKSLGTTPLEEMFNRHHTECVADCHAVLQSIRDQKNTDFVDLWAQLRLHITCTSIESYMGRLDGSMIPELEKMFDKRNAEQNAVKDTDTDAQKFLKNMFNSQEAGEYMMPYKVQVEYHTQPTIMAAKAFAEKALADGSLLKMSDKEVIEKCQEIVNASCLTPEKMAQMVVDVYQGKPNEDCDKAFAAFEKGKASFTTASKEDMDKEYAQLKIKELAERKKTIDEWVGIHEEEKKDAAPQTTAESILANKDKVKQAREQMAVTLWSDQLIDSLVKHGITEGNMVKLIMAEKDRLRENHKTEIACEAKIGALNAYLDNPDMMIVTAVTRKTVSEAIDKIPAPTVEKKGIELAAEFVKTSLDTLEFAYVGMEKSAGMNSFGQDMDAQLQLAAQSSAYYKEVLKNEKALRSISFEARKDKEAWEVLGSMPSAKKKMATASLHKHPLWLDQYHANAMKGGVIMETGLQATYAEIVKLSTEVVSMPQVYYKLQEVAPELVDRLMQYVPENHTGTKNAKLAKMPVEEVHAAPPMQMAARKQRSGR